MPTPLETLDAANAKLDSLISSTTEQPSAAGEELSPADAMKSIATELAEPAKLTKERKEYLASVLSELSKAVGDNSASELFSVRVTTATDRRPAPTRTIIDPINLTSSGKPVNSTFASTTSTKADKVEAITKLLVDAEARKTFFSDESVAKSAASDKLAEILTMFGLAEADLKDTYEVRWKIGDLLQLLQNQVKLERLIAGGSDATEKTEKSKAAETTETETSDNVWPRDMAGAKYDETKKNYEREPSRW